MQIYWRASKPITTAWLSTLDSKKRDKLVALGLVSPQAAHLNTDSGKFLGPFIDAYLKARTDAKAFTITNYKQTRRLLVEFFSERNPIKAITAGDAERFRRWMLGDKKLAQLSMSKHIKRCKTYFADAVADSLIDSSPFESVKAGSDKGEQKHRVSAQDWGLVLEKCPDAEWRCCFALARYAGMRRECETQLLLWSDIDSEKGQPHLVALNVAYDARKAPHTAPPKETRLNSKVNATKCVRRDLGMLTTILADLQPVLKWLSYCCRASAFLGR